MAAFDDLVVEEGLVKFFKASGKFASVDGAYTVIFGCSEDERFGVVSVGVELVVGGDGGEEFSLLWDGDSAVFSDPGSASCDLFVAEHIEQGYLDDDGIPHLGVLRKLDAHEEAAVGATDDTEATGRGDLAGEQILTDGSEVFVDALAMGFETGFMPGWAELAAATYICEDEDTTSLKPQFAKDRIVERRHGDLKSAIGVHQSGIRAVVLDVFAANEEVWDFGSVFGGRLELFDDEVGGVELGGKSLCRLQASRSSVAQKERGRREEAGGLEEEFVVGAVGRGDVDTEIVGDVELLTSPGVFVVSVDVGATLNVVERGDEQVVFGGCCVLNELLVLV